MKRVAFTIFVAALAAAGIAGQASQPAKAPAQSAAPSKAESQAPARDPGLYWTFETSMGDIHCKLYEADAPLTVRTMVRLALGRMPYQDPKTGQTVTGKKFFDGLTFHRVIPNFMIQGGDPLGNGQGGPGGPGFPFKDEFSPNLAFDVPGRLAMANAGPGTNGSQFFITEVPTPHLNGHHTIWGQCGDLEVEKAIARVPRSAAGMPNSPVTIKHVLIERVGPKPANAPEGGPSAPPGKAPAKAPTKPPAK
ncbi:MAG TPA: peptidylprolyl isomerase [Candidatus Solibacter sp.]|nr:peptidylprolyl isomerase [Candidatus Solibacter sp.]